MADLYEYNTDTGVVIPQTSNVKALVQSEWQAALGSDLSLVDSTPQGILIQNDTDLRTNVITANANMVNGFNIFLARGIQLDAIGATFGVIRKSAQPTLVTATCYGVPNTTITAGSLAQTLAGDNFVALQPAVIGADGSVEVYFASQEKSAIACPENSLSVIVSNINGWERITNLTAGILGYKAESDYSYRLRIFDAYQRAWGYVESLKGRLSELDNIIDSLVLENFENSTNIIKGVSIPAHSVAVIVQGASNEDIAKACLNGKSAGCGYTAITATYAYGYIVFSRNFVSTDTVTIGSTTATAGTDFVIGDTLSESINNLINSVSFSGVTLKTDTTNATTLYITAAVSGTAGNSIALATTNGTVSGATLFGGFTQDVSVTENVVDVYDVQNTVIFNRPYIYRIAVNAVIRTNTYSGTDLKSAVENAIVSWANNEIESVEGLKIGSEVNAWEISAAITEMIPDCKVQSVYVGLATGSQAQGSIAFTNNLLPNDTITIGDTVLVAEEDFLLGTSLDKTLQNIISVGVVNNILSASSDTLFVTYKYTGTVGNGETLATSASNATVTAMSGGVNNSEPNALNINTGTAIFGTVSIADMGVVVV